MPGGVVQNAIFEFRKVLIEMSWLKNRDLKQLLRLAPLALMLVFPFLGSLYHLVNQPTDKVYSLVTPLDQATPFIKYFALPYGVWIFYIYVCLVYFFFRDRPSYYRSLLVYTVCALTCYGVYLVFQTTVPRPEVIGNDPFAQLTRFIYNRDQPFNCFPSIHCFSSYMVMRMIWKSPARNRLNVTLISGMSLLIIASTLFMKQHVIMDVIGAIAIVEIYSFLFFKVPALYRNKAASRQREFQV
ncbi:phosphatase PAP2 family protein [Paenibacillus dokdonensis]|uniref:Phosphatase PAP2 family protein n=2 Tax=Paenibacillus dokdonensis TaxID=2567944 RepID=A0ABU6GPH8_9BACL|nr:phosphatase PAP2 family protein [Paenibacillus dokdonensis]MEC0241620.1 phosphatase PAP2 family protein [Paenibacillus dokdonensis]